MVSNLRKAFASIAATSELRLESTTTVEQKRVLPLGMAISIWLKKSMLIGAALLAVAITIISSSIRNGDLPTFVALMFDQQIAKGQVNNVQSRIVSKSKGMSEKRWIYTYHFDLPNGQQFIGECFSPFEHVRKGAQVDVEYNPKRPQANRIKGMSASSDENSLPLLGIVLMSVSTIIIASGLQESFATFRLLTSGLVGSAVVTHCKKVTAGVTQELNGFISKTKDSSNEILLADFQQQAVKKHRNQFDSRGIYKGTTALRVLHVLLATFYGALIGSFLAFVSTAFIFGFPHGWIILVCACFGATATAIVECRWRFLLRSNVSLKRDDLSTLFKKQACILEYQPIDGHEPIRVARELDLKGDSSDSLQRPILYLQCNPKKAKLLDTFGFKWSFDSTGVYVLNAEVHCQLPLPC